MTDEEAQPYQVLLTEGAKQAYKRIPSGKALNRLDRMLDVLDTVPDIGSVYRPLYEAATPPFELKVVYADHYGIYYRVLEEVGQVHVYYIEDQRRDPLNRFSY